MKKVLFLFTLFFTLITISGQSLLDTLEDFDDVSSFIMTKDAFELIKKFPNAKSEDMEVFNMAKDLNELKVFSSDNSEMAMKMESVVNNIIKKSNLTQLMRANDKDSKVKIYVKATQNQDLFSEVLMFVKNKYTKDKKQSIIVSLTGKIDVNKLSQIANKYSNNK